MVGNRRHIPEPMKQQWVTMSAHVKSSDIARVTHSTWWYYHDGSLSGLIQIWKYVT